MVRSLVRIKNQRMIEIWRYSLDTRLHVAVPQLDGTAPVILPAFVHVEDQIDATPPAFVVVVHGKVGVDIEEAPRAPFDAARRRPAADRTSALLYL